MENSKVEQIKKVVVIGPECTGKSDLSEYLAAKFNTVWVEEYAREYLDKLGRPYVAEDLKRIAEGQLALEDEKARDANGLLVCDTNLYVIKIWSIFKYGYCDKQILDAIARRKYDLYLLTYVDIPWEADPQREHPEQRELLYSLYLREMQQQDVPFIEIRGERNERRRLAGERIRSLLSQ